MKTQPGQFTHVGDGLCIGCDGGNAARQEYQTLGTYEGGTNPFVKVAVDKARQPPWKGS